MENNLQIIYLSSHQAVEGVLLVNKYQLDQLWNDFMLFFINFYLLLVGL